MWADLQRALDAGAVIAYGATPGWAAWLAGQLTSGAARDRGPAGHWHPGSGRAVAGLVVVVAPDDAAATGLEADVRFFLGGERDARELDPIATLPGIDVSPYAD